MEDAQIPPLSHQRRVVYVFCVTAVIFFQIYMFYLFSESQFSAERLKFTSPFKDSGFDSDPALKH